MTEKMFCFQCEQTAKGCGCTEKGVCGKDPETSAAQDQTIVELIRLARAALRQNATAQVGPLLFEGLFTTITNVNFDADTICTLNAHIHQRADDLGADDSDATDVSALFSGATDVRSLRATLLFGLKGMAAYGDHARILGITDDTVYQKTAELLAASVSSHSIEEWFTLLMDTGQLNLKVMGLLEQANTTAYGQPEPQAVTTHIATGPFIIVTGHDLFDLKMLLEQVEGTDVAVYTHGEMLPAHGYPELKKYTALRGHFGTAWNNQQREFDSVPAPILYTTNCIMPPKESYRPHIFTTGLVQFPGCTHIDTDSNGKKDFSQLIHMARMLGGYDKEQTLTGTNGGHQMVTGFGKDTILANAQTVIDAVQSGALRHIFLVGGCDGAKPGRSYYTEFVKQTPDDTLVLTLACGKFRFNDLDLGSLGGLPRLLDMGQCNDAYGAIQVAAALANAFQCHINELPLTLVLSWYEQKAVAILLTLLSLGIKNIYIGPSLPAFLSESVLQTLVDLFDLHPISDPASDLATMLATAQA